MTERRHHPNHSNDECSSYIEESSINEENYSSDNESTHGDPARTTTKYHEQQAQEALQSLKDLVKEKNWKRALTHKSGMVVYSKHNSTKDGKAPIYMAQHEITGFAPQSIFAVIGMRKLWDEW